ncbi:MAG: HlyD family secretion protein [Acidobacteriota bacterium]
MTEAGGPVASALPRDVPSGAPQATASPAKPRRWIWLAAAAAVPLAIVAALALRHHAAGRVSTDDAQIDGHVNPVAARVGGTIAEVAVTDNQVVASGAVLVRIDARELEVAVARAKADLLRARAEAAAAHASLPVTTRAASGGQSALESELLSARARVQVARAHVVEAEAAARKKEHDAARLQPLVAKEEISRQQYDAAVADADMSRAALDSAKAAVVEAEGDVAAAEARLQAAATVPQQLDVARARADAADAHEAELEAALQQAEIDLEHAVVRAPVAGTISRRGAEVGQIVQPGQPLLAIVPGEDLWVTANFKESQLRRVRPGQRALVKVDAYGGRVYRGRVDSIAAATGARFSLLPPENATGNFVKVVQRIPVKIAIDPGQDPDHQLRPGMSVVPTVLLR